MTHLRVLSSANLPYNFIVILRSPLYLQVIYCRNSESGLWSVTMVTGTDHIHAMKDQAEHSHRCKLEPVISSKFDPSKRSPKAYPKGLKPRPLTCRRTMIRKSRMRAEQLAEACFPFLFLTVVGHLITYFSPNGLQTILLAECP
jgi:hypothetical protein